MSDVTGMFVYLAAHISCVMSLHRFQFLQTALLQNRTPIG